MIPLPEGDFSPVILDSEAFASKTKLLFDKKCFHQHLQKIKRQAHITKGEKPRYHLHSMNLSFSCSYAIVKLSSMTS